MQVANCELCADRERYYSFGFYQSRTLSVRLASTGSAADIQLLATNDAIFDKNEIWNRFETFDYGVAISSV